MKMPDLSSRDGFALAPPGQRARVAAVLALCSRGRLLDPRAVATALGYPPPCSCPPPRQGRPDEVDPGCVRHCIPPVTPDEVRELLPAARQAVTWPRNGWGEVYLGDPASTTEDGFLANVVEAVLTHIRRGWQDERGT